MAKLNYDLQHAHTSPPVSGHTWLNAGSLNADDNVSSALRLLQALAFA